MRGLDPVLDFGHTARVPAPDDSRSELAAVRKMPEVLHALAVYRPERHHARGGLGEVLAVRQEELGRLVALKRIQPERLHEAARKRFVREAEITARLQHPGIVPIYGLGRDDDGPFYTMPLIEGQTLQEAIEAFYGDVTLDRSVVIRAGEACGSASCFRNSRPFATPSPIPTTRGSYTAT